MKAKALGYTVIIERSPENCGAWVPDLPGCVATGASRTDILRNIKEAIEFHLEGMHLHGEPTPEPSAEAAVVVVNIA